MLVYAAGQYLTSGFMWTTHLRNGAQRGILLFGIKLIRTPREGLDTSLRSVSHGDHAGVFEPAADFDAQLALQLGKSCNLSLATLF